MKTFIKRINNANTQEELKNIMKEVFLLHAENKLSDNAFDKIYDAFLEKKDIVK
jgi:hypothetical protein